MDAEIVIFGGSAHPELAAAICSQLRVPLSPVRTSRFANDCLQVQLQANCRERDVYLIQPVVPPAQENLVELLLMADAARGASAARVTAVMSHYAYARSDKKDAPRISIGGRLVADLLVTAGVNRVLTLTLHSPEVHGFFSVPVDHLHALRELAAHFRQRDLSNTVVLWRTGTSSCCTTRSPAAPPFWRCCRRCGDTIPARSASPARTACLPTGHWRSWPQPRT